MKPIPRLISILLIISLIFSFCACDKDGNNTAKDTEAQNTTVPAETDASEIFAKAAEKLLNESNLQLDISLERYRKIGVEKIEEAIDTTIYYNDIYTEKANSAVETQYSISGVSYSTTELYINGQAYFRQGSEENSVYCAPITSDEFIAKQTPVLLFSADNFESVSISENNKNIIVFESPTAIETWIAPDHAELTKAKGTVKLTKEGKISQITYSVSYRQGAAIINSEYYSKISYPKEQYEVAVPVSDKYINVDTTDTAKLLYYTHTLMNNAPLCSGTTENFILSDAAGITLSLSEEYYSYSEAKDDYIAKISQSVVVTDSENNETSQEWYETYIDGKSTITIDGGEPQERETTKNDFIQYINDALIGYMPSPHLMDSCTITDIDSHWIIDYTAIKGLGEEIKNFLERKIFGEEGSLDKYASGYTTSELSGFIAIDKDTLFPTSIYILFTGIHKIDGYDYRLYMEQLQTIQIGDKASYKAITGSLPETKPPKNAATPLFYEVTAENGNKMYLLGTIHIGDERTAHLPKEIYDALDASDALAVEININDLETTLKNDPELASAVGNSYFYTDGTQSKDHWGEELYEKIMPYIKAYGQYTYSDLIRGSVLTSIISNNMIAGSNLLWTDYGVDTQLIDIAKEKNKEILEVEDVKESYESDTKYSDKLNCLLLEDTINTTRSEYINISLELYEKWCKGKEDELKNIIKEDMEMPEDLPEEYADAYNEYIKSMNTDRDAKMLDVAIGYLKGDKVVFYAVGLAHLLSDSGLIDGLREAGYTVELVEFK